MVFKRIKNLYTKEEKKESDRLDNWYNYIRMNKRQVVHSFILDQNYITQLLIDENRFLRENNNFINKTKPKIYENIINLKENKLKDRFINNNKQSFLPKDILGILYDYYEENPYIYLIKIKDVPTFYITNKIKFLKNIFLNNETSIIYRLNGNKIVNKFQETYVNIYPKTIYNYKFGIYNSININYKTINDFYSPLISIKIFYFKKNHKKIKKKYFNLTNYNDLYHIDNFLKNHFLTKYEFYCIKSFNFYFFSRILITTTQIKEYKFLIEINEYLYKYLHKMSNYKYKKSNKLCISC